MIVSTQVTANIAEIAYHIPPQASEPVWFRYDNLEDILAVYAASYIEGPYENLIVYQKMLNASAL